MSEGTSSTQEKGPRLTGDSGPREPEEDHFHEGDLPAWRFWLLSTGLCLGLFLSMLDSSIVATSLYSIGSDFNENVAVLNWVALAYTLSYLSCVVLFARMADVMGRRNAFLAAFVIFFAFSLGCGFAQNLSGLIACRAFQGIGGSGLYSLAMIIWPEVSSQKMRQFISSLIGLVIAISGVLGPVLGGVLTRYASWRWIFWINGPIGFVSMILFYLSWPTKDQLPNLKQRSVFDLDFVGSSLLIAAAVLVTFSFQFAGGLSNQDLWAGPVFIATITIGLVCWVGLFVWSAMVEKRWANRLLAAIPMALVRNRVYAAGVINTMFVGFPFFMTVYTFPLRTQVVNGKNPLQAGIALLPMLGAVAAGSALGPAISRKKNYMVETLIASGCLMVVGLSLETTLSASEALQAKALGFLVLIGLGFGLSASTSTLMTILESPIREHAPAQGILGQFRILGGSIGIAASTAILSLKSKKMLAGAVYPSNLSDLSTLKANASPELWEQIRQTYAAAFTKDMQVGAIVTAIGIIFAIAMWPKQRLLIDEMRQRQIDEETAWRRASNAPVLPMPTV